MTKANEPAYPLTIQEGTVNNQGLSKREKLAMEIYARAIMEKDKSDLSANEGIAILAQASLRAADIFFEQLNK